MKLTHLELSAVAGDLALALAIRCWGRHLERRADAWAVLLVEPPPARWIDRGTRSTISVAGKAVKVASISPGE